MSLFRVLLIDDDEEDYILLKDLLREVRSNQYEIVWKSSYEKGRAALHGETFDVCLLDHRLGAHTGLELLRESQDMRIRCPIILLTGQGDFDLDIQAMQTGAAEYLVKSQINAPLLERSIRYAMKHALDKEDLRDQRELFRLLFDSTFEGIFVHRDGRIVDVNRSAADIFGVPSDSLKGENLFDLVREDSRQRLSEAMAKDVSDVFEAVGVRSDGSEIFIEVACRSVLSNGRAISLVAVRDRTERKELEAQILQQDRLASLGLLASSLAHEIGTPLGIIRSRTELIAKKASEGSELKADMGLVIGQIDRITKLIRSLLHLARGKKSTFGAAIPIQPVMTDILNLVQHELQRKDIRIDIEIHDEQAAVKAEPGLLGQVLLNMFVNSVHAIEEARKAGLSRDHRIAVLVDEYEGRIRIRVKDTGIGVPEKNIPNLFKPFFTTKEIGVGTGLGLATSYKFVHSWGGTMAVESREGEGATFTITLDKAQI